MAIINMRLHITLICLAYFSLIGSANGFDWNPFKASDPDKPQYEAVIKDDPVANAKAQSLLEKGKSRYEAGHINSANRVFKKIAKKYKDSPAAGEALYLRGLILMEKKRYVKAFNTLQEAVRFHPKFTDYNLLINAQFECATALMDGARGKIFGIIPGFKQEGEAINQFEYIIANAPYGNFAPLSLMNISFIATKRNDSEIAIDALDRLINFYPQSTLAPDAYYNLAKTYADLVKGEDYDQGSTRQAISYYEDLMVLFPENKQIGLVEANLRKMENLLALSRFTLGDFYYFYRNNNTAALTFYNETITLAPESEAAAEAAERIADIEAGVKPTTGSTFIRKLLFAN